MGTKKPGIHKVHIFWEGHKILRNVHCNFVQYSNGQIYSGDFSKFFGFLRIHELYSYIKSEIKSTPATFSQCVPGVVMPQMPQNIQKCLQNLCWTFKKDLTQLWEA